MEKTRANQCLDGGNCLEHEEYDGKTGGKNFVIYFSPVFFPEFMSSRLLKRFLRDDEINNSVAFNT
jgi:hypothetical protein